MIILGGPNLPDKCDSPICLVIGIVFIAALLIMLGFAIYMIATTT